MTAPPTRTLTLDDPDYPSNLRGCPRPPDPLWIRGTLLADDAHAVAVVGTRRPTPDGRRRARQLAGALAREGITVISGLAAGIDAEAHAAALETGGRTVAVLAYGLDHPTTPAINHGLVAPIQRSGALVSPYPPGTAPTAATFRARNAVMAGLARVAVVIEAGPTSGARVLARQTAALGRPVLLTRSLLTTQPWALAFANRHGAGPLDSLDEVLAALDAPLPPTDTQLALPPLDMH